MLALSFASQTNEQIFRQLSNLRGVRRYEPQLAFRFTRTFRFAQPSGFACRSNLPESPAAENPNH
jgi:hypothetical protein